MQGICKETERARRSRRVGIPENALRPLRRALGLQMKKSLEGKSTRGTSPECHPGQCAGRIYNCSSSAIGGYVNVKFIAMPRWGGKSTKPSHLHRTTF
jgi:hypothetical protein